MFLHRNPMNGRKAGSVSRHCQIVTAVILTIIAFGSTLYAEDAAKALNTSSQDAADLPPYDFKYTNPLYATLAGFLSIKDPEVKSQKTYKLSVESFRKKYTVKATIQNQSAPLVVFLPGFGSHADSPISKLWPAWFADAGYHVLTFDSSFTTGFVETAGIGVSGNVFAETEAIKNVITAFMDQTEVKGNVSKIGVVGMSYGGIQALVLGQMANEGHLPFKIEALQSFSPPVSLGNTMRILDRWYAEDRWQYTLADLKHAFAGHEPVGPDHAVPFSDSIMRAGVAAIFRLSLADIILKNNDVYKLNVLPKGNTFDDEYVKQDYAEAISFSRFLNEISFPYWQKRLDLKSISDFAAPTELQSLMEKQPQTTQLIVAEDDPFNATEDVAAFKTHWKNSQQVTFLPRGGHLGYVGNAWVKAKLLNLFKPAPQARTAAQDSKKSLN